MKVLIYSFQRISLGVFLILNCHCAQAQGTLELKTNIVPYLVGAPINLSGEYLIKERIGIEASVWYGWDKDEFTITDTITGAKSKVLFKDSQMVLFGAGKYYFSPKNGGDRFFAGVTLYHQFYLYYKRSLPSQPFIKKPSSETGIGAVIGYKWMIKKRFVLELDILGIITNDSSSGILPSLKVGYRL